MLRGKFDTCPPQAGIKPLQINAPQIEPLPDLRDDLLWFIRRRRSRDLSLGRPVDNFLSLATRMEWVYAAIYWYSVKKGQLSAHLVAETY